ncbi:tRNA synthetases class I-domain-containing protein [Pseudomassariella vexata]|uniref:Tyrosine--tRNA ligase n=1 Tax=Pseudomassariella vexata TaxID=1141098 RepID=A0A1Y2E2W5_9PEZI|nr:tRNA synthetases class I-domain-containing protein [Pseudomassariella vexata]ORY65888.1 tRNA synthetases class I-domain-containing protein [Pseudomassariella vexata]
MTPEASIALIKANLAEVLNPEIIDDVILNQKRPLKVYWGTAPTGKPHCGYFVPMVKVAELLHAGCHVKILIADIHAYLDNMKAPLELVEYRAQYYEFLIKSLLTAIGVDIAKLEFVRGSSYQLEKDYTMDRYKLEGVTRISVAQKAGAEVVKQMDDPCLGGLIYPLMQALDEQYLDVDCQAGGVDQRKIFTFALENLPRIGYKVRAHLMNAMVPGLGAAAKMSSSEPDSKIDLLDTPEDVGKKLKKAHCAPKTLEGNGVVAFVEHVIFRVQAIKTGGKPRFVVERERDGLEALVYDDIAKLKDDFEKDILTPQLLKAALTKALNDLLAPIRTEYLASEAWQKVSEAAYPPEKKVVKEKKVKSLGDPAKKAEAERKKAEAKAAKEAAKAQQGGVEGVKDGVDKLNV